MVVEVDGKELSELRFQVYEDLRTIHRMSQFANIKGPTERIEMDHMLKQLVFKLLYFFLANKGRSLKHMFPDMRTDLGEYAFPETVDDIFSTFTDPETDFFKIRSNGSADKSKHDGRNCGRKFRIGEPIYRCHECGFDDTCVLCIHCFNPKDHENHHIYTDICNDFTSGICDCGDEEAWKTELHCKANAVKQNTDGTMEDEIKYNEEVMVAVIGETLDYFIDVFNQNIEPLPTFTKDITLKLREMVQKEEVTEMKQFLHDLKYKTEFTDGEIDNFSLRSYTVMIYNDEYHNYSQATMALRQGVPDNVHTDILTSKIDSEGRAMLKCSDDVDTLMAGFFAVQTNGLSATLTSWDEYIHQETCKYIVQWLNHCLTIPESSFQTTFRNALGRVLCEESSRKNENAIVIPSVERYFPNKMDIDNVYKYLDSSLLTKDNKIPLGHHKTLPESSLHSISTTLNATENITEKHYSNTRLQHLLYFDNRYWKKLRKDLQNVIIPTLSSSIIYKSIFCEQVVEIFNHITNSIAYMDREPQLTALRECVVQLFTCPTNAMMIFDSKQEYFVDIIWSIIDLFVDFCKSDNGTLIWQRVQKSNPTKSFNISLKQGLYTIETLLSKVSDPNIMFRPKEFVSVVTLCKLFNGAWKIKRKEGEHVLHEDQHFIPYLEYTTSVYSIIQTIVNSMVTNGCDEQLLLNAINLINTFLGFKSLTYKLVHESHEVIKFTVSSDRVAFMNPIHTFFSSLIENVPVIKAYEAIVYQDALSLSQPTPTSKDGSTDLVGIRDQLQIQAASNFDFLKISDFSLRSIILCSQIDVGFWVRNGMSVLHQTTYYKNNPELNTYSRDIHLNQLAFLWEIDDVPRVIYNVLDRWELLDWFDGNASFESTIYQDKIFLMVQHFISFVYQILTERQFFQIFESPEERRMFQIKNAIIYNLYTKPLSYSKLLRRVPDYLIENTTDFDAALNEVSLFIEPKGLADNGVFKLKESVYSKIDPLKLSNLGNEFESSATIIKTNLTKNKKDKDGLAKIILQPQLVSPKNLDENAKMLGAFTRHPIFAKIIYKLLQVCLDTENGTFLNELLHLLHGIFKDDELVNGKLSIPDVYIGKPICNLLLSISNTKSDIFSENITSKADYLLKRMILKKPDDVFGSLVDSFGEQCVEAYKSKKLNEGVNLEETEREKKRRLAKKHQARLMAKFNNQQSKFMKENKDEFKDKDVREIHDDDSDVNMTDAEKIVESEDFTCSLCQDSTSQDLFVIPAYHDSTPTLRKGNLIDISEFMPEWNGFENNDNGIVHANDKNIKDMREDISYNARKSFVSCNHHIHHSCFKRYIQKKRFSSTAFICPLCQTFSNCTIPTHPTIKTNLDIDVLNGEGSTAAESLMQILKVRDETQVENFLSIYDSIYTDSQCFDRDVYKKQHNGKNDMLTVVLTHWTNTISMLEIGSRLDKDTNSTFLISKEQKFKTLKNILIFILLSSKHIGSPANQNDPNSVYFVEMIDDSHLYNQLFQYIVRECLFSTKPLSEIIQYAISCYSDQFFVDFYFDISKMSLEEMNTYYEETIKQYGEVPECSDFVKDKVFTAIDDTYVEFMETFEFEGGRKVFDKLTNLAYVNYQRHILPTLRKCFILLKTFHILMNECEEKQFTINGINLETELIPVDGDHKFTLEETVNRMINVLTGKKSIEDMFLGELERESTYLSDIPHEFCGIVKLVNLSKYLNTYVTDTKAISLREENDNTRYSANRLDFKICLTCGVKVHLRSDRHEMSRHLSKNCFKSVGVFLIPNSSEICLFLSHPPSNIFISAPYLNSHGEAGRNAMKRGDLTTLNLTRYEHLNKLWINNEIPGYISRVMGDEFRVSILSNGFLFAFNREPRGRRAPTEDDADEEDEEFFDEEEGAFLSDEELDDEDRFRTGVGQPGDVRDFFQIFDTVRNAMENNGGNVGEGVDLTTPFLQFFGPQFRGADRNSDDEGNDENQDTT